MFGGVGILLHAEFLQAVNGSLNPTAALVLFTGIGTIQVIRYLTSADAADGCAIDKLRADAGNVARAWK